MNGAREVRAYSVDEDREGDAAGRRRRCKANGKQRLADVRRPPSLLIGNDSTVLDDGAGRCLAPVDGEHLPRRRNAVLLPLVGDGRIRGQRGEIEYSLERRDGSLLIVDDIALAQDGGERGGRIVQCDLREGGEAARLSVQRVGDAPSRRREMRCAQHLAEGAVTARDNGVAVAQNRVALGHSVVDENARRDGLLLSVEHDIVAICAADYVTETHGRLGSVLSCDELDAAVVVNGGVEARALAVDGDLGERPHRPREAPPLAVHGQHQPHAGAPVVLAQTDARREESVGDVELAEVEETVLDVVDPDREEMQRVDRSDLQDAERRDCVGGTQLLGQIGDAVHRVGVTNGDAADGDAERLCYELRHHRCACAAADQHDRLRRFAVQLEDLLADRVREMFDPGLDGGEHLIGGERELHAEDVGKGDVLSVRRLALDVLSDVEVEKVLTRDGLGDLVARHRHHAVGDDRAVARDGDVRCACADIDEHEIQMAHRRWDEDVDARDRLKREGAHLEVRLAQCRLHGVHDLSRQKGCNDVRRRLAPALPDERLELVAVERIADCAVADAVVARRIIDGVGVGQFLLCLLHARKVEVALLRGRNRAREVLLCIRCHRVEGTPCRRHSSTGQRPCTLHEAVFDLADDGSDLRHIVNLPVEHGTRTVLEAVGR